MDPAKRGPKNYLIDVDGVLLRGSKITPGADVFVKHLQAWGAEYDATS